MKRPCTLTLILLLAACGGPKATPPAAEEHAEGRHDAHAPEAAERSGESGVLRIAPEMLRDLRVTTSRVEARPASEEVVMLGEVGVNEDAYAEVGVPVQARVVAVRAALGEKVRAGQVLAELQSMELGRSRGEHDTAAARVRLAQRALERKTRLARERIVPQREVQEAEAALAEAQASLRAAGAALGTMGTSAGGADASRFALRSPVSGVVIERDAVRGEIAEPTHTLFRVGDLARLWLRVHAYERDAVRIPPSASARVTFPALPGATYTARVTTVGRQVEATSRTIPVQLVIDNPEGVLRPGMSARASVPVGSSTGTILTVPLAALQRVAEDWCVFIPRSEGAFEVRSVGRGRDIGGEVEVVKGLSAGERVVVEGSFLLKAEADKARGEGGHHDH
jgi:cobalt-zinc-cadmium efflux system membrane fusion protein